jgi:DNA-binding XRE family transcriptional regulator
MARNFKLLQAKMSSKARRRSEAKADRMIREMALDELRVARQLTQEQLAAQLKVKQPAIAKLERRADMYLSTPAPQLGVIATAQLSVILSEAKNLSVTVLATARTIACEGISGENLPCLHHGERIARSLHRRDGRSPAPRHGTQRDARPGIYRSLPRD